LPVVKKIFQAKDLLPGIQAVDQSKLHSPPRSWKGPMEFFKHTCFPNNIEPVQQHPLRLVFAGTPSACGLPCSFFNPLDMMTKSDFLGIMHHKHRKTLAAVFCRSALWKY
jgi:hypothetical protein